MPVEFRVLGPLEIRRDGAPIQLRASRQRTFLGALLVQHGRVVSVDRLIEDVWPDAPPAGARHALETHASRLRSLLGDDLPLVARAPGYALELDPRSLDSVRFEQLLGEARASEPARAAVRAADALALWRGDALAEFRFDTFAQEEIARLEELRQDAEEERIAALLALGQAQELVGELEALVAAAPLRERRRAQLMLALYRSGRQADALAAYQDARRALLDELGLEPGRELRELERAILRHDASLAVARAPARDAVAMRRLVSVVAVEPALPLDAGPEEHERARRRAADAVDGVAAAYDALRPEPFVLAFAHEDHAERAATAAAALRDALGSCVGVESGDALVADGAVGGGVVERARRRAREGDAGDPPPLLERRADGPFVGRTAELEALRETRAALVVGAPGIGKTRLLGELARDERVAVGHCTSYLANALAPLHEIAAALGEPGVLEDVNEAELPLMFRQLCERSATRVAFDDVHWADPLVLETIEQLVERTDVRVLCLARVDLLEERPGFLAAAERIELEPLSDEEASLLAAGLGAVDARVVARAEGNPLFVEQLLAHTREGGDGVPDSLRALLLARFDRLTPLERDAVQCAAVIGRDFDASLVADLLDAHGAREPLAALVRRGLVDPAPPTEAFEDRYRFRHPLIHDAAYSTATDERRGLLHERAADLLLARGGDDEVIGAHLERAARLYPEGDRRRRPLAEDASRHLAAAGMSVFKRGFAARTAVLLDRAASLLPAADPRRRELLCELGVARSTSGDAAGATEALTDALDEAERARDARIALRARIELAAGRMLNDEAARPDELLELAAQAEPLLETLGDDRALGRVLLLSGWVRGGLLGRCGEWEEAAARALAHYRRAGLPTSTPVAQIAAAAYYGPMHVDRAVERLVRLEQDVDDLPGEATLLAYRGALESLRGESASARDLLGRARSAYSELGRKPALLMTCAPLEAEAARLDGDPERAAAILFESCTSLREERRWSHFASQAAALADALHELGRGDAATWAAAAETHARSDDVWAQIAWRSVRARIDGEPALAREAVRISERTDLVGHQALALLSIDEPDATTAAIRLYEAKGNVAAAARAAATSGSITG
jgi:DNA-binding SARP family transcriptional activator